MVEVNLDWPAVWRTCEAAISEAEQDSHEALGVTANHQVVGAPHCEIEMIERQEAK